MKEIPGYEGLYAITEDGKVWSYPKNWRNKEGKFLRYSKSDGYYHISLCKGKSIRNVRVHKLVGLLYVPNPYNLPVLNHLDGNRLNNHYTNLEWTTVQKNVLHGFHSNGRIVHNKGKKRIFSEGRFKYITA